MAAPLRTIDYLVDTGDMVELRGERYRRSRVRGVINVGGLKAHPRRSRR